MKDAQFDLFGSAETAPAFAPPPEAFVARIRAELLATLARAESADGLPWPDLTAALLAERRFQSICNWLPKDEGAALWARFDRELDRLFAPFLDPEDEPI